LIRTLKNPIDAIFIDLIHNSSSEICLASPFVKLPIAEKVAKSKKEDVRLSFLTNFKLASLYRRSTDIEALRILGQAPRTQVKSHQTLHAKTYIFDQKFAIVTSGNLTSGGLSDNYEYGVLIEEPETVKLISRDFLTLFLSPDKTAFITSEMLDDAFSILSRIPKEKVWPEPLEEEKEFKKIFEESDLYEGGTESIIQGLSGWKRSVFLALNQIKKPSFELRDVYAFEESLSREYPDNRFIKDKIRQQLQVLRDLGLLRFHGGGKYSKLWIG
jgi:phosphatidylserine/phosphatidylglycerophosphate/cardiolipin synthase-like enzyme